MENIWSAYLIYPEKPCGPAKVYVPGKNGTHRMLHNDHQVPSYLYFLAHNDVIIILCDLSERHQYIAIQVKVLIYKMNNLFKNKSPSTGMIL